MSTRAGRLLRVPATITVVAVALVAVIPPALSLYPPYVVRPGISCVRGAISATGGCRSLADLYHTTFFGFFVESMCRSLVLLLGAALLALVLGTLVGMAAGLLRRRVWAAAGIVAATTLASAVPAFFIAYFLQILVIFLGATSEGGKLLPVFGFGYDNHVVLPLLSLAIPPIAYTAQLTATRASEVMSADFITAAQAKGLPAAWLLRVHVFPHVRPVIFEGLGSGLRVSVASLPIIEYLFMWRGIGQLGLEAVGVHDAAALLFCALVLVTLFVMLSALADISRPAGLYAGNPAQA